MKILLMNSVDRSFVLVEPTSIFVTNDMCINDVSYDIGVALYFQEGEDEHYVILPDVGTANEFIGEVYDNGKVNLISYATTTFINPDEEDLPRVREIIQKIEGGAWGKSESTEDNLESGECMSEAIRRMSKEEQDKHFL